MKIVLHVCCGVCAAGVVDRLSAEGHKVTGFFYNPNIYPPEEYQRRLEAARKVARELNFSFEEGPYTPEKWNVQTRALASEPEGGKRCAVCFRIRLEKTYSHLLDLKFDAFTTTLTVSPHKPAAVINRTGREIGGDRFLVRDFKKRAGFQHATGLAKKLGTYRQDYCGCLYSMKIERINME